MTNLTIKIKKEEYKEIKKKKRERILTLKFTICTHLFLPKKYLDSTVTCNLILNSDKIFSFNWDNLIILVSFF